MKINAHATKRDSRGFSLIELSIAVGLLGIVVAIAMSASSQLVRTNANVSNNVDTIQQGRQFMDQISNDLHMAGYPNYKMFDHTPAVVGGPDPSIASSYAGTYSSTATVTNSNAAGMIQATHDLIQFEGDIDNSGNVSEVYLRLVTPAGAYPCTSAPCVMQRGTVLKSAAGTPAYYTELTGVMNQDVFSFFDYHGDPVDTTTATGLINTRAVRIKLQIQSARKDIASGAYSIATLDSEAKLSN
jgi:prepilin-type N-terminal cleavage/methylation domain-containing protein